MTLRHAIALFAIGLVGLGAFASGSAVEPVSEESPSSELAPDEVGEAVSPPEQDHGATPPVRAEVNANTGREVTRRPFRPPIPARA